jgi:hypothetical protein
MVIPSSDADQISGSATNRQSSKDPLSPAPKPIRNVSFDDDGVQFNIYPSSDEFSQEEVEAAWFSKAELHSIERGNSYTIFLLENRKSINERRYCSRGLEDETEESKREVTERVQAARAVVLNQQSIHREQGSSDPESIAALYGKVSSHHVIKAHMRAKDDQNFCLGGCFITT